MAKKTTKKVGPKKTAAKATSKKTSASQPPRRVFAIRVTDKELTSIHKAAGPRNASRFVRAVAAAFANADESAFRKVLKEAQEVRA